jgi:hypothetical protein
MATCPTHAVHGPLFAYSTHRIAGTGDVFPDWRLRVLNDPDTTRTFTSFSNCSALFFRKNTSKQSTLPNLTQKWATPTIVNCLQLWRIAGIFDTF